MGEAPCSIPTRLSSLNAQKNGTLKRTKIPIHFLKIYVGCRIFHGPVHRVPRYVIPNEFDRQSLLSVLRSTSSLSYSCHLACYQQSSSFSIVLPSGRPSTWVLLFAFWPTVASSVLSFVSPLVFFFLLLHITKFTDPTFTVY